MKIRFLFGRAGLAALAVLSTVAVGIAANLSFSTGAFFIPGYRTIDGTDLNVMVNAINALQTAVPVTDPMLIGTGVNQVSIASGATGVVPKITVGGASADGNIGISFSGKGTGAAYMGGTTAANASLRVPNVTSAVNEVEISGAVATTGIPYVSVGGASADANASISFSANGTGATLLGGKTTTLAGLQVAQTASRVNDLLVTPGATGTSVILDASTAGADTNTGIDVKPKGSGVVKVGGAIATCNGTTTATCQGQRIVVSVTGLTTAASTLSAAMTVTDATVASSSSIVMCQTQGYAGTGVPVVVNVTPGTGSVAFNIQNVSTGAALNATVAVGCFVYGS